MADQSSRYISNLTRDTYALILAGGKGSRLQPITNHIPKILVNLDFLPQSL